MLIKILNFIEKALSEKDCESGITLSGTMMTSLALPAAQPWWAQGRRRGRGAKPADDAGFFKGKDDAGCYPSGRRRNEGAARLCRAQAIGY